MMDAPSWESLVREASARGLRIATAESCTGGLIASNLTDVHGASSCYLGGFIAYSDGLKTDLLGVSGPTLQEHGAVSREAAEAMAMGCHRRTGAEVSFAVTGIAGPTGGTPGKPVGTVYLSVLRKGREPHTEGFLLDGLDRREFKHQVTERALGMLLGAVLAQDPAKP